MSNLRCKECKSTDVTAYTPGIFGDSRHRCNSCGKISVTSDFVELTVPPPTNGDVIRQEGDKALAEISIYKEQLTDGVVIYRSTLIEEKYWLSRGCAIRYVECLLNALAESDRQDEERSIFQTEEKGKVE